MEGFIFYLSNFFFTCNSCSDFTVYNKESALTGFSTSGMIHPHTNTKIKHKNRCQWVYYFFNYILFLTVCPIIFTTPVECSRKSSFSNCSRHIISCIPLVFPFVCRSKRQNIMLHKKHIQWQQLTVTGQYLHAGLLRV